ncbi:MAG: ATP synthase F1 subunit gamma [Gemmataceae bacterium]
MAQTRAIVKRRKAVRNIRKITRTMELIATARYKKALDRATEAEAFTRKIAELAADLTTRAGGVTHPLLETREKVENTLLLVITSNRGLCGGYNAAIIREAHGAVERIRADGSQPHLEISGKRGIGWARYRGIPAEKTYTNFEDKPRFEEVNELAERYIRLYVARKIDRVEVCYTKFLNVARQAAVVETLLPLGGVAGMEKKDEAKKGAEVEYEFLPGPRQILEEILPISFKIRLFKCFLDAAVSEQIARRVAMKAATENAGEMIRNLSREYNRARQAQITKEIAEVIGGAEALK